jgi:uncharacterized membrane protein YhaH (DUF805 family)
VSTPYSPYGQQGGGGQYGPPGDGQYGSPSDGQYGAPSGGQYGPPGGGQYGAPGGGPYDASNGGQYGQPGYGPYGGPNAGQYGQPGAPYGAYPPPGFPSPGGYLQGAPVDFQSAIRLQIANVTNFNGRAAVSAYWWYALAVFAVNMVLEILSVAIGSLAITLLIDLLALGVGLSGLSVGVRRLHDSDKSGWLVLLGLIPFVGWLAVLILLVLPGTRGQNRFG